MHFEVELREFPAKSVLDEQNIQGSLLGPDTEVVEVPPEPADRHPRGPKNPSQRSVRDASDPEFVERMEAFLERRRRYIDDIKRRRGESASDEDIPELKVLSVEYIAAQDGEQAARDARELEELSLDPRDHNLFLEKFAQMQERRNRAMTIKDALTQIDDTAPGRMGKLRSSVAIQQKMVQQLKKVVQFQTDKLSILRDSFLMVGRRDAKNVQDRAASKDMERTVDNLRELYEMEVLRRRDLEDMVERYKSELLAIRGTLAADAETQSQEAAAVRSLEGELDASDEMVACGMAAEAGEHLERICAKNPESAPARNALGVALYRSGRAGEALDRFDEAIGIDPRCVDAYVNRGFVLVEWGRVAEAAESFQNALMLDPSSQDAVDGLMECEMVRMEQA